MPSEKDNNPTSPPAEPTLARRCYLKADLHVHSYFSGKTDHVKPLEPMDSYSSPERIFSLAKARGMDLVTITDHDSIDGCLDFLDQHPEKANDFIVGEEVTVQLPEFETCIHIGVYDITESQHREISERKACFDDLLEYLKAERIIHVFNHFFHGFPRQEYAKRFVEKMLISFDILEGINGAIPETQNRIMSEVFSPLAEKTLVAGSDSHTLLRLGHCFTMGEGATKREFLESLRQGRVRIFGNNGRFTHTFNDAMGVYLAYFRDVAFRNEVHRDWSRLKKIRNGLGWAGYLPVFFTLSLLYSFIHYYREDRKYEYYLGVLRSLFPLKSPCP